MSVKRLKVIDVFIIFGLCFLTHFMYTWFSNTLFSIFFPVNESIWEHMKLLFTAIILAGIIDYILLRIFHFKRDNFLVSLFISSVFSILVYLSIYLPFYYMLGESMPLNLIVLFITIIISQLISFLLLNSKGFKQLNCVCLIGIILVYIVMGLFTYYPLPYDLFFDPLNEKYGINTYQM